MSEKTILVGKDEVLQTRSGKVLTADDIQKLADEAEAGYDIERLLENRSVVLSARIPWDEAERVRQYSEAHDLPVSQIVRRALRSYLSMQP